MTEQTTENIYLRLYLSAFKSGLVADLKAQNFTVLLTICSYMNESGECYPTQEQIAERSGASKATVTRAIKFLLAYEFNGKPLISREIVQKGPFKNSVYKVNPIAQVAIFGGEVEAFEAEEKITAAIPKKKDKPAAFGTKDVIEHFFNTFMEVYGVRPTMNYAMVTKMIREKWLGQYTEEQIKKMIDIGVREYDTRWKNAKYPRPTLVALISWLGVQAHGLAIDKEKEFQEVSEMTADYVEVSNKALNRLTSRLNK